MIWPFLTSLTLPLPSLPFAHCSSYRDLCAAWNFWQDLMVDLDMDGWGREGIKDKTEFVAWATRGMVMCSLRKGVWLQDWLWSWWEERQWALFENVEFELPLKHLWRYNSHFKYELSSEERSVLYIYILKSLLYSNWGHETWWGDWGVDLAVMIPYKPRDRQCLKHLQIWQRGETKNTIKEN